MTKLEDKYFAEYSFIKLNLRHELLGMQDNTKTPIMANLAGVKILEDGTYEILIEVLFQEDSKRLIMNSINECAKRRFESPNTKDKGE